jgi:hypothetical protein
MTAWQDIINEIIRILGVWINSELPEDTILALYRVCQSCVIQLQWLIERYIEVFGG